MNALSHTDLDRGFCEEHLDDYSNMRLQLSLRPVLSGTFSPSAIVMASSMAAQAMRQAGSG